jgi:hypothetical protein
VPRILGIELEARPPFAQRRHGWIEDTSIGRDFPLGAERRELIPIDGLNRTLLIAEEDETTGDEACPEFWLEPFESAKESVDRAARSASRRLIYGDGEEPAVFPVSSHREWGAVRIPL